MLLINSGGEIVLLNARIERIFCYSHKELLDQSIGILVPQRFCGFFRDPHAPSAPRGAGVELYGLRKNGSEVPLEIGLNPLRIGKGDFVLSSIIDTTELQQAEKWQRRQRRHTDVTELMRASAEEIIGQSVTRLIPQDRLDEAWSRSR